MTHLRRLLGPLAALWLLCQGGFVVTASALSWSSTSRVLEVCTCIHGDHEMCPMHHRPAPGKSGCQMNGTDADDTAVLSSIFSVAGVVPTQSMSTLDSTTAPVMAATVVLVSLHVPPDSPPPRA